MFAGWNSCRAIFTDIVIWAAGTSVWYHVVHGEKIFFFCPPTQHNLDAYAKWTTSNNQSHVFFGDLADACYKVTLRPGNTMFIAPGEWWVVKERHTLWTICKHV